MALLAADALLCLCEPSLLTTGQNSGGGQDLGGGQDHDAEKDVQERQKASRKLSPASRCPLEQEPHTLVAQGLIH
jgi:hypothetical protein